MEKGKSWVIGFGLLALGLIVMGWILRNGVLHFKESERVVSVRGLSEREVKADKVIWPLTYKVVGDNLLTVYNTIESSNAKVVEFLKANGISAEEISIPPAEIVDMDAERYVNPGIKYRYNVTSILTVVTSKVDLVVSLMSRQSDLLKQGVAVTGGEYKYQTQFLYTSDALNKIKPDMIEEATKNARISAEKFAHDSDSHLGKIRTADQGQISITNQDENTPYLKVIRVVTSIQYYLKD